MGEIVLKPSHLSNGSGLVTVSAPKPHEKQPTVDYLIAHMTKFLCQKADAKESAALRSLRPGFVAQPRYRSVIGFKAPLELRVQVLWGRARMALWWWGRGVPESTRNAWFVRRLTGNPAGFSQDEWEVIHDHPGHNKGFFKALELFKRHIREMAAAAESLAVAMGAPFLRADFFVGSSDWGLRLNEVAYGCGADYRNFVAGDGIGNTRIVDDAPAIARILLDGMSRCRKRLPSEHFLSRLGVQGTYTDMTVADLHVPSLAEGASPQGHCPHDKASPRSRCPHDDGSGSSECEGFAVAEEECSTPRNCGERLPATVAAAAGTGAVAKPIPAPLVGRGFNSNGPPSGPSVGSTRAA